MKQNTPLPPLLEVKDLRVSFGAKEVVHGVDFSIAPGEKLALVGESGSGKTVTALALLRLVQNAQLAGAARFQGGEAGAPPIDLLTAPERTLRGIRGSDIAMIFQEPMTALNPLFSVGEQIAEVLQLHEGLSARQAWQAAVDALAATGIPEPQRRAGAFPHQLSGGQRQRAMIAMALACKPRLLLADEPTTALDVTTQSEVMAILDELRRARGLALLFITHDLDLAAAVCDRIAVMYAGSIVETRAAAALHDHPLHPYSAALAAARPSIDHTAPRLLAVPGRPVSAFEAPDGCAFAPRCTFAQDRCRVALPPLEALDGGHVRCVRAAELRGRLEQEVTHG
jgi:microcin C transport system ATP-binding protein